ncbi:hypothetical protein DPMN_000359 [Dreissena polymorpha]|uniref:Uncharacterized protein n=1 Tax=Dreissena polymorpha TaxID=45954 RepID=A0A9D4MI31_DREPO|nr:hypothetical protein DPMN_000359 [Dreissena polymorpha]
MYLLTEPDIQEIKDLLKAPLRAVTGTLSLHQVKIISEGQIAFRNLSCDCEIGIEHKDHEYQSVSLIDEKFKQTNIGTYNRTKGLKRSTDTKVTECQKRRKTVSNGIEIQQPKPKEIQTKYS